MDKKRNALFVSCKEGGLADFARKLVEQNFHIYACHGLSGVLTEAGVDHNVIEVVAHVGGTLVLIDFVRNGLLIRRDSREWNNPEFRCFELVCLDWHPSSAPSSDAEGRPHVFEVGILHSEVLMCAAKGLRLVVSTPSQRQPLVDWLEAGEPGGDFIKYYLGHIAYDEAARYNGLARNELGDQVRLSMTDGIPPTVQAIMNVPWQQL